MLIKLKITKKSRNKRSITPSKGKKVDLDTLSPQKRRKLEELSLLKGKDTNHSVHQEAPDIISSAGQRKPDPQKQKLLENSIDAGGDLELEQLREKFMKLKSKESNKT